MAIRTTTVAGRFFPQDKERLENTMSEYRARTRGFGAFFPSVPRAIVAPHAGYAFCGGLAAGAWALTAQGQFDRIAILSPSHCVTFDGIAVPTGHDVVAVPGKRIKIDSKACKALIRSKLAAGFEDAFKDEHGIDTQLPFSRKFHPKTPVVPIVIGKASDADVAAVIDRLVKMTGETLFVLSSDLSHFLTRNQAARMDAQTAMLLETGQGARLTTHHACGVRALAGWLASAEGQGGRALRLGQLSSYETNKDADRVVGYGAWGLFAATDNILADPMKRELLHVARRAIQVRGAKGKPAEIKLETFPHSLRTYMASFVTLEINGRLRGCVGSMQAHRPLVLDVAANAARAAFEDRRFKPLTASELAKAEIKVSALTRPAAVNVNGDDDLADRLVPGESGLILSDGDKRALFLPSVWASIPDPRDFIRALKQKAGFDPNSWKDDMRVQMFRSETFGESELAQAQAA